MFNIPKLYVGLLSIYLSCVYCFQKNNYAIKATKSYMMVANKDHDILVRALKGENVERTPVWLMRQVLNHFLLIYLYNSCCVISYFL